MKRIAITLPLDGRGHVPAPVLEWLRMQLVEHVLHESAFDYRLEFVPPRADGPPLDDDWKTVAKFLLVPAF